MRTTVYSARSGSDYFFFIRARPSSDEEHFIFIVYLLHCFYCVVILFYFIYFILFSVRMGLDDSLSDSLSPANIFI